MTTKISIQKSKLFNLIVITISLLIMGMAAIKAQGFKTLTSLAPVAATASTGEKPQSKVWFYQDYWFAVIPASGGTFVYRLDGSVWTQITPQISIRTLVQADVKLNGNKTYILLKTTGAPQFQSAELITIDFQAGTPPTYTKTTTTANITMDNFAEMVTLDIDSDGRMWIASDGGQTAPISNPKNINIRWSDPPYNIWSTIPDIILAAGINNDDICSITAFDGNKIGVLWSDQTLNKFGFAYHIDGDLVNTWTFETAALDALFGGIGDDHINLAVASDGTIYAAVKTSYTNTALSTIGLLVRRPAGTWDPIYTVTKLGDAAPGTRPIVLLNESENILTVVYTERDGWHDILYKESFTSPISFPVTRHQFFRNSSDGFNDVSSTKQNYTDSVVVLFSTTANVWEGVIAKRTGPSTTNGAGFSLAFDGINDQLRVEPNSSINFSNSFTIEAWIKPGVLKNQSIMTKYSGVNGFDLSLTSGGQVTFKINSTTLTTNQSYSANVWTHIAAAYSSVNGMKIYINGIPDPNILSSTFTNTTARLLIGSLASSDWFNGAIDEVRLWNTERTIDNIRANMCQKLAGSESNLVGYWNFDTQEGLNVPDLSANGSHNNFATMQDMNNYLYSWSGAAIGNASAYDYTPSDGFNPTLSHPDGDMITADATSGSVTGLQVYRVDSPPLRLGAINNSIDFMITDPLRYWGVKIMGTGGVTYDVTYNYNGHPGITNENDLNLVSRNNLSDNSWEDLFADLNTTANTITKTGLTGTEFALVSGSAPLPVELSLFNVVKIKTGVKLIWRTETEVNNYGFEVERNTPLNPLSRAEDEVTGVWEKIGFVNGNGNSNSPKDYSFLDETVTNGSYLYRLKQIDNDGQYEFSDVISVDLGVPSTFALSQNYPNPFNPSTKISYTLPIDSKVSIKVYDVLGNLIETLVDEQKQAGYYEVAFNSSSASGVYFYTISADNFHQTKKMLMVK